MFARVMSSSGGILNIVAPVTTVRLAIEIPLHKPQPTKIDCIRTKSVTPEGTLVNITRRNVPLTMECIPNNPAKFIVMIMISITAHGGSARELSQFSNPI